ncbi:NUDIX hydrolase [Patescibacteria group bacterium]|nr:NUDIX hydrolase [Patescibacteria group bacterium]
MNNKIMKWIELSREVVFEKYGRAMEKVDFRLPDGSVHDVYVKREGPVAGCLALTKDKKIIVLKQFRPGPMKFLYDLPGGLIESGSDPGKVMEREFLEETGYKGEMKFVTTCYHEAYSTYVMHVYVATNCEKVAEIQDIADDFGEDEKGFVQDIELILVSVDEYKDILRGGLSTTMQVGYLGLDYLGLL